MYINCVTKNPIAWGAKAKLFFICPKSMDYFKGLQCENDFNIIGLPMDAIYKEKMNFKLSPTDKNSEYSINKILEMNKNCNYKAASSFPALQKEIQYGKVNVERYGEEVFVNVMAIKEEIYNYIISSPSATLIGDIPFSSFKNTLLKERNYLKENKPNKDDYNEDEFIDKLTSYSVKLSDFSGNFLKMFNLSPKNLFENISDNFDSFVEALFVLRYLEEKSYLITPAQVHSEGNNKRSFLKELIKIQEEKEVSEDRLVFKEI